MENFDTRIQQLQQQIYVLQAAQQEHEQAARRAQLHAQRTATWAWLDGLNTANSDMVTSPCGKWTADATPGRIDVRDSMGTLGYVLGLEKVPDGWLSELLAHNDLLSPDSQENSLQNTLHGCSPADAACATFAAAETLLEQWAEGRSIMVDGVRWYATPHKQWGLGVLASVNKTYGGWAWRAPGVNDGYETEGLMALLRANEAVRRELRRFNLK